MFALSACKSKSIAASVAKPEKQQPEAMTLYHKTVSLKLRAVRWSSDQHWL